MSGLASLERLSAEDRELLRRRARELAVAPDHQEQVETLQVLSLWCREQVILLPISCVLGVGDLTSVAEIPRVPRFVRGMASFRGEILVAADLGILVADQAGITDLRWVIAVASGGLKLGLVAERIPLAEQVPAGSFQRDPGAAPYVAGIDPQLRTLLEPQALIEHVFATLKGGG